MGKKHYETDRVNNRKLSKDHATNYRGNWENYLLKLGQLADEGVGPTNERKMCLKRTVA